MTIAPEGLKMLRLEVRNAETAIEKKSEWIKNRVKVSPEYTELMNWVKGGPPAKRVREMTQC